MEVSKENIKLWRRFTKNGDMSGNMMRLVEKTGLTHKTVKKAIISGEASLEVIKAINTAAKELLLEIDNEINASLKTPAL